MATCVYAVLWIDSIVQVLAAAYRRAEQRRQRTAWAEWRLTMYIDNDSRLRSF